VLLLPVVSLSQGSVAAASSSNLCWNFSLALQSSML
jgi:hypothetical protein